jgi:hypothetical protein
MARWPTSRSHRVARERRSPRRDGRIPPQRCARYRPSGRSDRPLTTQAYFRPRTSRTFQHRQFLGGHQTSLCESQKKDRAQPVDNAPRITPSTGWPPSFGLGGRFRRNEWPLCLGFRNLERTAKPFPIHPDFCVFPRRAIGWPQGCGAACLVPTP